MSEPTAAIVHLADDSYQALRELAHLTARGAVPAPVLSDVLGHLKQLGPTLEQTLRQLAEGLLDSLTTYEVFDDDGADPLATVTRCCLRLADAAVFASLLGPGIDNAQAAIAYQGYHQAPPDDDVEGLFSGFG